MSGLYLNASVLRDFVDRIMIVPKPAERVDLWFMARKTPSLHFSSIPASPFGIFGSFRQQDSPIKEKSDVYEPTRDSQRCADHGPSRPCLLVFLTLSLCWGCSDDGGESSSTVQTDMVAESDGSITFGDDVADEARLDETMDDADSMVGHLPRRVAQRAPRLGRGAAISRQRSSR